MSVRTDVINRCKRTKLESKSQPWLHHLARCLDVKELNLKANHNKVAGLSKEVEDVKELNLKANHNAAATAAVLASDVKELNLKANHNNEPVHHFIYWM